MAQKKKTNKRRTGPDLLTPRVMKKIVNAIKLGNYIETACEYAGISKDTFYRWLKKGETEPHSKYAKFLIQVREALAVAEAYSVQKIKQSDQWQSQAWWLERKFPDRWGKREVVELQENKTVGEQIKWDDEVNNLIAELTRKLTEEPEDSSDTQSVRAGDNTLEGKVEAS